MADPQADPQADFQLADWCVQPAVNRLQRGNEAVQIEPKMMDVLVYLAGRQGDVVRKRDIIDNVWKTKYVSESVISRAIAGLRKALGDRAQSPQYIATIPKRGYQLLPVIRRPPGSSASPSVPEAPGLDRPFVVGQWVSGHRFYGRACHIDEILNGPRSSIWLLGTRAIGKTSMLRQIELIAGSSEQSGFVPVFWDMQGAASCRELGSLFEEAVLDAEDHFSAAGIEISSALGTDLFTAIGRLRRLTRKSGRRLLLLCDEVDQLIELHRSDPGLLGKLRRALQSSTDIRSVIASSPRLWALAAQRDATSPFLHGFTPPLYLTPLQDDEASALIFQRQIPEGSRVRIDNAAAALVLERCGNHPFLLQMVCSQLLEVGDANEAVEKTLSDRAAAFFFAVDFDLLGELDRAILRALACTQTPDLDTVAEACGAPPRDIETGIHRLQNLGFVRLEDRHIRLVNELFRRWLCDVRPAADAESSP